MEANSSYKFKVLNPRLEKETKFVKLDFTRIRKLVCGDDACLYAFEENKVFFPNNMMKTVNNLHKYNFSTRHWSTILQNAPQTKLVHSSAIVVGGLLMVWDMKVQLHVLDFNSEILEFKTISPDSNALPRCLSGFAFDLKHHGVYAVTENNAHRFCLKENKWETVHFDIIIDDHLLLPKIIAFYDSKLYKIGKTCAFSASRFDIVSVLDVSTGEWKEELTHPDQSSGSYPYPEPDVWTNGIQHGSSIYTLGAVGILSSKRFRDIWRLDLANLRWTNMGSLNDSGGWYFGGFGQSCITPSGKLFTISEKIFFNRTEVQLQSAWLKIPSLKDMAWDAVCHYSSDLNMNPADELLTLGIPKAYVERLGSLQ